MPMISANLIVYLHVIGLQKQYLKNPFPYCVIIIVGA